VGITQSRYIRGRGQVMLTDGENVPPLGSVFKHDDRLWEAVGYEREGPAVAVLALELKVAALVKKHAPDETVAWYCTTCGRVFGIDLKNEAEECCAPYTCNECGADSPRYHSLCDRCRTKKEVQRHWELAAKAEKCELSEFGMIYDGDKFYHGVDELEDDCEYDQRPVPPFVWGTSFEPLQVRGGDDLLEGAREEHFEGCEAYDEAGLIAFLTQWNRAQVEHKIGSYYQDSTRIVVLDPEAFAARLHELRIATP